MTQHVTLAEVKTGCLLYHKAKKLLAQAPKATRKLGYVAGKYRCALAVAFNDYTIATLITTNTVKNATVNGLVKLDPAEEEAVYTIQEAHDQWLIHTHGRKAYELRFLALLT